MPDLKKFELSPSLAILIAGVIIAGAIIFTNTRSAAPAGPNDGAPTTETAVAAPTAEDHIVGSPSAPLVLIEYADFECYYCGVAYPTIKRIVEESNGQIAWVHRHLPLESIHPQARPSALASECIAEQLGSEGFWKFADAMYANQSKMGPAYYRQTAVALGADGVKYDSCFASNKYGAKVDAQAAEAMQNGGNGTPYTILYTSTGQTGVSGALPYEQFVAVINAFRARQ